MNEVAKAVMANTRDDRIFIDLDIIGAGIHGVVVNLQQILRSTKAGSIHGVGG